jgi:hypothetical protein
MKSNDVDTTTARIKLTATGALDHAALQAHAQQLRREALSALIDNLFRCMAHAWAVMTRRPSPTPCNPEHADAGN